MKQLKLAVFDIDGVLNEHGGNILPESIKALAILEEHGVICCYASGKGSAYIFGGLVFAGLLREKTVIIAENGGVIFQPASKRTMYTAPESLEPLQALKEQFLRTCTTGKSNVVFQGEKIWIEPKETLLTVFPRDVARLSISRLSADLTTMIEQLSMTDHFYLSEHVDAVDVIPFGVDKGRGIEVLCDLFAVSSHEIMAVGDDYNDRELLGGVGFPVAVANAREKIKELVRQKKGYICNRRCGHGVLEAVQWLSAKNLI